MDVHIFVFLLIWSGGGVCYGDQTNSIIGDVQEQNAKNPKYQKMANELAKSYLNVRDEDTKNVTVIKVTTQVVSGIITKIQLRLFLVNGQSTTCNFNVWEQKWKNVKYITHKCDSLFLEKLSYSNLRLPEKDRNPTNLKYLDLAQLSIDSLFESPGRKPFEKKDVNETFVSKAKVEINTEIKITMEINVITVKNDHFKCTSRITEAPWALKNPEKITEVNCKRANGETEDQPGSLELQNPKDPKYKELAIESLKNTDKTDGFDEVHVTKVTTQVVSGIITRINFIVLPNIDEPFTCHSEIIEQIGNNKIFNVSCPGGPVNQNPMDPKYKQLAVESLQKYQQTNGFIKIKELKVNKVTTQVDLGERGVITRIKFNVIPTKGQSFSCHSRIVEQDKMLSVNCDRQNKSQITGGLVPQNPKDPKYKELATESFKNYQKNNSFIRFKELEVTNVTTQVESGIITQIDFNVIPTRGKSFSCHSQIIEQERVHKILRVTCDKPKNPKIPGGLVPQNPKDPKYKHLATKSFRNYQQTNGFIGVKELKVTKVTTQEVSGLITRIEFIVIPTKGKKFACRSQITDQSWVSNKIISVTCDRQNNPQVPGGLVPQNPNDPKYKQLATKSFKKYQETYRNVIVKDIKVNKVTTQIVSGAITRIEFDVIPKTGKSLSCHSEIVQLNWVTSINCNRKPGSWW